MRPVYLLRKQFKAQGWQEDDEWSWRHPVAKEVLDFSVEVRRQEEESLEAATERARRAKKRKNSHVVREGFRGWQWQEYWTTSNRHEASAIVAAMGGVPEYPTKRMALARQSLSRCHSSR